MYVDVDVDADDDLDVDVPEAPRGVKLASRWMAVSIARTPLFAALLVPAALLASPWEVESDALEGDPRLPALRAVVEGARQKALRRLRSLFELEPGPAPVRWILGGSLPTRRAGSASSVSHFEAGWSAFRDGEVSVFLPAYRYLARPQKACPVIHHEATHALLASRLGSRARYEKVPAWFREGLALHVAGEGEARVEGRIALSLVDGKPAGSFLKGLRDTRNLRGPTAPSPAESYLAVRWLARAVGRPGFRVLVRRLAAGEDLSTLLTKACGQPEEQLRRMLDLENRAYVQSLVRPEELGWFRSALGLLQAGDTVAARSAAKARPLLEKVLRSPQVGPLRETARYYVARALEVEGLHGKAMAYLEEIVDNDVESLWEPEALWLLGLCRREGGDPSGARRLWEEVVERFPEDREVVSRAQLCLRKKP